MTTLPTLPITSEPLAIRPPYDHRDPSSPQRLHETVHQWWDRRLADGLAALSEPLEGIDVSDYELGTLEWLTGREDRRIAVIAALLHRARAAQPLSPQ